MADDERAVETARVRDYYERKAVTYDRTEQRDRSVAAARAWLGAGTRGRTLEIGIGSGLNLAHYPADVDLVGVELSPAMLAIARLRARELDVVADLRLGDAQALDFPAGSFDTVVFCLTLCSVPDDRAAMAEAVRVLRPGGQLRLVEHVRSPQLPVRMIQRLLDPISVRVQRDHLLREPAELVVASGLEVRELERWSLGFFERLAAVKPGAS